MLRKMFFFLLFVPGMAWAGCGGGLHGTAGSETFYIGTGDCEYREDMISMWNERLGTSSTVRFNAICSYSGGDRFSATSFKCKKGAHHRMAASSYVLRFNSKKKDYCGKQPGQYQYECVKGCTTRIPKYFEIHPEECD